MNTIQLETPLQTEVVSRVLSHLNKGEISEATALFGERFQFNDWGIGLEFTDRERLAEFFEKSRELYPDSILQTDQILVSGDWVTIQWVLHMVVTEPFFGGLSRRVPISLRGASIIRTKNGKITDWADYYDGLKSRRTALAGHFEEWVEL